MVFKHWQQEVYNSGLGRREINWAPQLSQFSTCNLQPQLRRQGSWFRCPKQDRVVKEGHQDGENFIETVTDVSWCSWGLSQIFSWVLIIKLLWRNYWGKGQMKRRRGDSFHRVERVCFFSKKNEFIKTQLPSGQENQVKKNLTDESAILER